MRDSTENREKRGLRGSFTVEAAFLFPILVFLTAFVLQTAIALYEDADRAAADAAELEKTNGLELFWDAVRIKELKEEFLHEN